MDGPTARLYRILTPLLPVTDDAFRLALSVVATGLGPNDRLHVGTCLTHGIETIVSADLDFERLQEVRRVDPLDATAIEQLLGGGR